MILLYKTSAGSYREVIKSPEFDFCLIATAHFDGFLLEQMAEIIRTVLLNKVTQCPLKVVEFWNITIPSHKIFSYLPTGQFKFIIPIRYDDKGPNLYNITGTFQFESIKDKLGN